MSEVAMNGFKSISFRRRGPRIALTLVAFATLLILACDLQNGNSLDRPQDPPVVIDPTTVDISVFTEPGNIPADGNSYSTIHARIKINGQEPVGIPVLFYSEWGTVFTACGTPTTVTTSSFRNAIITGTNGEASTLIQAPVLPNLYAHGQESNTVAAFFLVNGFIFRAVNNQNLWQVGLDSLKCAGSASCTANSSNTVTVVARYLDGRNQPISACNSAVWTASPANLVTFEPNTLCATDGTTRNTFRFNPGTPTNTAVTVQVATTFTGAGLNECVLDTNRDLTIAGSISIKSARRR
jgi:hypothetical protein